MRRPLRSALPALMLLAACGEPASETGSVIAEPIAFEPDFEPGSNPGGLSDAGGLVLDSSDPRFGGWSAMEISPDGQRLLALSDSASWMTARLIYDEAGQLAGLGDITLAPLLDSDGEPLDGTRADAEGLADLGDSRVAVSFEREHRIWVYDLGADWRAIEQARPVDFPAIPGADRLRANAGAEALARVGDTLWVAIEYPIVDGQPHTLWRFDLTALNGEPVSRQVAITPGFGLTGLGVDRDDSLIVVERFWQRGVGNRIRLGRIDPVQLDAVGAPVTPALLATIAPDQVVDNIEAVAIAQVNGQRRLFLLSDDNFNERQRTLLLSFAWPTGSDEAG